MSIYRYNGPVNLTRAISQCKCPPHLRGKPIDFTFYKGELYEGKWINKGGDFGDFVLSSGEEIECLDMTDFKDVRGIVPIKPLKTYSFRVKNLDTKEVICATVEATCIEIAKTAALFDTRFKCPWTPIMSSFKCTNSGTSLFTYRNP